MLAFYAENNELVDLDNKVVGSCTVDGSDDYDCFDGRLVPWIFALA